MTANLSKHGSANDSPVKLTASRQAGAMHRKQECSTKKGPEKSFSLNPSHSQGEIKPDRSDPGLSRMTQPRIFSRHVARLGGEQKMALSDSMVTVL